MFLYLIQLFYLLTNNNNNNLFTTPLQGVYITKQMSSMIHIEYPFYSHLIYIGWCFQTVFAHQPIDFYGFSKYIRAHSQQTYCFFLQRNIAVFHSVRAQGPDAQHLHMDFFYMELKITSLSKTDKQKHGHWFSRLSINIIYKINRFFSPFNPKTGTTSVTLNKVKRGKKW